MIRDGLNPWAGLASYEDPETTEHKLKFCGRDDDIFDVTKLVVSNVFVTLYGKSGIGKTSLLNAGVFPELREEGYMPVNIRLGIREEQNPKCFQRIIIETVERIIARKETINIVPEQNDANSADYLWNYFARHRFYDTNNEPTLPVIVLDQFEEVFRNGRDEAEVLLRQLDYMNDKDHVLDACNIDGVSYRYEQNFRFVVSIREDDFYRLEDSLDNCYLPALKRNRFRLRSLSEEDAQKVILIPGEGLLRPEEKDTIVRRVIEATRQKGDDSISTNLLSLICNRLYNDCKSAGSKYITGSFVVSFMKENPIEKFYSEATKGFTNQEKAYIEDHLVDSAGRRNSISESDYYKNVPGGGKLLEGDTRILQRISASSDGANYRIELIHDSFCEPLLRSRNKRKLDLIRQRNKKRLYVVLFCVVTLFLVYLSTSHYINTQNKRANMILQASELMRDGEILESVSLLLNIRNNISDSLRLRAFHKLHSNSLIAKIEGNGEMKGHSIIPKKNIMIVHFADCSLYVWDYCKDRILKSFTFEMPIYDVAINTTNNYFLIRLSDGSLRIYDFSNYSCIFSQNEVQCANFSESTPSNIFLLENNGNLKLYDFIRGIVIKNLLVDVPVDYFTTLHISPSENTIFVNSSEGTNYIVDWGINLSTKKEKKEYLNSNSVIWNKEESVLFELDHYEVVERELSSNKISSVFKTSEKLSFFRFINDKLYVASENDIIYVINNDKTVQIDTIKFQPGSELINISDNELIIINGDDVNIRDLNNESLYEFHCENLKNVQQVYYDLNTILAVQKHGVNVYNNPDSFRYYADYKIENIEYLTSNVNKTVFVAFDKDWSVGVIDHIDNSISFPVLISKKKIEKIEISPNGNFLLYYCGSNDIQIMSLNGSYEQRKIIYDSPIVDFCILDNQNVVTITEDSTLVFSNRLAKSNYRLHIPFQPHSIVSSSNGEIIAVENNDLICVFDKNIFRWKHKAYIPFTIIQDYVKFKDDKYIKMSINNDRYLLVSGLCDNVLNHKDLRRSSFLCDIKNSSINTAHFDYIIDTETQVLPNKRFYTYKIDNEIVVMKYLGKSRQYKCHEFHHHNNVKSYLLSSKNDFIVSTDGYGIYVWSIVNGELLYEIKNDEVINNIYISDNEENLIIQTDSSLKVFPLCGDKITMVLQERMDLSPKH